jgi:membrane protein required for colicin V production
LPFISFGVVFLIVVVLVSLLGRIIKTTMDKPVLGPLDQGAGALLGLIRATFMLSIMLWIADSLKIKFPEEWMANSWLHPMAANFAPKTAKWIGGFLPFFGGVW